MKDLIYRETARRIIDSPRTHKQMLDVLASVNAVEVIPTSKVEDTIAEIKSHIQPTKPNKMDNREFNAAFYITLLPP